MSSKLKDTHEGIKDAIGVVKTGEILGSEVIEFQGWK